MERRKLGQTDIAVAPLAFGGNVFGWTVTEGEAFRLLDRFTAEGFNLIDTADVYSNWVQGNKGGESEQVIGNWMKSRKNREQVIIATKVGSSMERGGKKDLSRSHIMKAVEDSLKRLQTDYIDLYQSHYDDLHLSVQEPLEAYDLLIRQGKVRTVGASNFSDDRLRDALEVAIKNNLPRYQTFQPEYNLVTREEFESTTGKVCTEFGLSVIPYYSLASGFLTGKYRGSMDSSKSPRGGRAVKYLDEKGLRVLDALDELSKRYSTVPAAIALAWLAAQPPVAAPIASATSIEQLNELISSAHIKLDLESLELLDRVSR